MSENKISSGTGQIADSDGLPGVIFIDEQIDDSLVETVALSTKDHEVHTVSCHD